MGEYVEGRPHAHTCAHGVSSGNVIYLDLRFLVAGRVMPLNTPPRTVISSAERLGVCKSSRLTDRHRTTPQRPDFVVGSPVSTTASNALSRRREPPGYIPTQGVSHKAGWADVTVIFGHP